MKKFFGVLLVAVAIGLAARYFMNKWPFDGSPKQPSTPSAEKMHVEEPSRGIVDRETVPEPVTVPEPEPETVPEPPRIANATQITGDGPQHFAVAPGVIYYCHRGDVIAQPKDGGPSTTIGDCSGAFDFVADAQGVLYCDSSSLMRITAGTEGNKLVAEGVDCILMALDGKYAYYVVPGFEGNENPGVYRVARAGGTPERIHATTPKEQFSIVVDDDAVWISAWSAGTISKLAKTAGAKARTLVTGQKGIVDFGIDAKSIYWYAEGTREIRRRAKAGGPIEVIGKDVDQEPLIVIDGHVYWFEGMAEKRLVHLAPGAKQAEELASDLRMPTMRADSEGVYVTELDRDGLFWFKR